MAQNVQIVPPVAPLQFAPAQMDLIRRTVAKQANEAEFDQFLEICKALRLNPLRRQIYCFIFNAGDPAKRQMVPVTAIDGFRAIAARTQNYRPDDRNPTYKIDRDLIDPAINPVGIVSATVRVFKYAHGEWHKSPGQAFWDEYVPLVGKADDRRIDFKKDGWRKMPRIMISKCAEAQALRKAWPDDFASLYETSEIDRHMIDVTPSEAAEIGGAERRLESIGGADAIMIDWMDGEALDRVPLGKMHDACAAFIEANKDTPMTLRAFEDRNRLALKDFWARRKTDALNVKKLLNKAAGSDS